MTCAKAEKILMQMLDRTEDKSQAQALTVAIASMRKTAEIRRLLVQEKESDE